MGKIGAFQPKCDLYVNQFENKNDFKHSCSIMCNEKFGFWKVFLFFVKMLPIFYWSGEQTLAIDFLWFNLPMFSSLTCTC